MTVYDRNEYIGGRSTTVYAYDDPSESVELGGSVFVKVNHNLMHAAKKFGLRLQEGHDSGDDKDIEDSIGVWDGETWRYISPWDPTNGWWAGIKLIWQYGMAPLRTNNLMKDTVGKFLKMYDQPNFPFKSLTRAVRDVGLADTVAVPGDAYLSQNNIAGPFSEDIIQASTRVNYAQNLDSIHGVETMVCMATDGAMSVAGGNWQIFASMLGHSGAQIFLNTTVTSIDRQDDGTYNLATQVDSNPLYASQPYDTVILASPFQFANLTLNPPPVEPIPAIPYVKLHVTLFTSPYKLDPQAFNLPPTSSVPKMVLTTTHPRGTAPEYNSISLLRSIINPATQSKEYLYKVFSPAPASPAFLRQILATPTLADGEELHDDLVTWRHEKLWYSYPVEHPRVTFEETYYGLQGGGGVWYTSGIEGFISTMETSSLMGMNVARLIVDAWEEERRGGAGGALRKGQGKTQSEL